MSQYKTADENNRIKPWYHILVIITTLASCANLIFVTCKLVDMHTDSNQQADASVSLACFKCETLPQDSELLNLLSRHTDKETTMCCVQNLDQLSSVVDMVKKRSEINSKNVPLVSTDDVNITDSHTSAHIHLLPPVPGLHTTADTVPYFKNGSNVRLHMNATYLDPLFEHSRNVEILPTGLHIRQSGLYHVYSSVYFRPEGNRPCSDFQFQTWHHGIVKSSPNVPFSSGTLLQSIHTCCDDCTHDKETSYAAGVFNLRAGDHLYVEVSGYGLISFHRESNYLGLTMLGAGDTS